MKNYTIGIIASVVGAIIITYLIFAAPAILSGLSSYVESENFQKAKQDACGYTDSITDQYGIYCCTTGFTLSQGCVDDFIRP